VAGETDLVLGGLTAIESVVDTVVFRLVCEPMRKEAKAASRGRGGAEEVVVVLLGGWGGASPLAAALLEMRAASWFKVGGRLLLVFFGADEGLEDDISGVGSDIVMVNERYLFGDVITDGVSRLTQFRSSLKNNGILFKYQPSIKMLYTQFYRLQPQQWRVWCCLETMVH